MNQSQHVHGPHLDFNQTFVQTGNLNTHQIVDDMKELLLTSGMTVTFVGHFSLLKGGNPLLY